MRYSEAEKRVVYEPVSLPQDFRSFDFLMPWEGPEYRLPGDEKAAGEGPGAPTPAAAPTGSTPQNVKTPAETPKTTDTPAETGAGKPGDVQATKEARKPRATKAEQEVSKPGAGPDPKPRGRGKPRIALAPRLDVRPQMDLRPLGHPIALAERREQLAGPRHELRRVTEPAEAVVALPPCRHARMLGA